jgi:hypothetical protein
MVLLAQHTPCGVRLHVGRRGVGAVLIAVRICVRLEFCVQNSVLNYRDLNCLMELELSKGCATKGFTHPS